MTSRTEFRRRLDRLAERLPSEQTPAGDSNIDFDAMSIEELNAYIDMRGQQLDEDPEYIEQDGKINNMTEKELDEYMRMLMLHPSERGNWKP